jgi:hypothetical protein
MIETKSFDLKFPVVIGDGHDFMRFSLNRVFPNFFQKVILS